MSDTSTNPAEKLSLLFNHLDNIILYLDPKGNILDANKIAIDFFKIPSNTQNNLYTICQSNQMECPLEKLDKNNDYLRQEITNDDHQEIGINWKFASSTHLQILIGIIMIHEKQDTTDHLYQIVDYTPGSLYWKDREGRYLGCNKFMADTAGIDSIQKIIGKTDEELWPQFANQLSSNDQQVIHSGKTIYTEEKVNVEGHLMYFVGVKSPLKNKKGEIIGVIGNSLDITTLMETQERLLSEKAAAEAENYAKSEFIANMSHDIRTPLAGIIGLTEILISSLKNTAIVKFAKDTHRAANQLMQLFNEILEISDIEADNVMDTEQTFNLQTMLNSISELMAPSIEHKGLTLHIDYDNNIPTALQGYRIMLHRVLLNLVSNAIKFTPKGNITIKAELINRDENNVVLRISVADTGIGIPEDKIKLIFEPFKRLTPAYENKYQGTGLGLYVVKKFLDELEGNLTVKSEPNQGSTFKLAIPLKIAEGNNALINQPYKWQVENTDINSTPKDLRYKVLVVEDDPMAQIVSKIQLNKQQCHVDIAATSAEAISLFRQKTYDLILMDIGLPDKNGCETTCEIRLYEKNNRKTATPIIALTAHLNPSNRNDCQNAGINHVLQKPLSHKLAEEIVSTFLDQPSIKNDNNPINLTQAENILGGNKEIALELLTLFMKQLPPEEKKIGHAFHQRDWSSLKALIHKLHGASSYCGVNRLKEACLQLETLLKQEVLNSAKINKAYNIFIDEIKAIKKAFKNL